MSAWCWYFIVCIIANTAVIILVGILYIYTHLRSALWLHECAYVANVLFIVVYTEATANVVYHLWLCFGSHHYPHLIWTSLSKPLIMTTASTRGITVSMYVSFTPHLSHPGSRDLCMPWSASFCFNNKLRWCAHVRGLQLHALDWTVRSGQLDILVSAMIFIMKTDN